MTTITIRASDAVTALEMVQRRLGEDALILSTRSFDGLVEVEATDDPAPPRPVAPQDHRQAPAQGATQGPTQAKPDLPSFLTGAAPVMAATQAKPDAPNFSAVMHRRQVLQAGRIVLYGPAGAGKSIVAIQLALQIVGENSAIRPRFFFCGSGSRSDGALLAQKSRLLGMDFAFSAADHLPAPQAGTVQIVVVSARHDLAALCARTALDGNKGVGVLVLPAGLRADILQSLARTWTDKPDRAILSVTTTAQDAQSDHAALARLGITALWISAPDTLVGGLEIVTAAKAPVVVRPPLRTISVTSDPRHHP